MSQSIRLGRPIAVKASSRRSQPSKSAVNSSKSKRQGQPIKIGTTGATHQHRHGGATHTALSAAIIPLCYPTVVIPPLLSRCRCRVAVIPSGTAPSKRADKKADGKDKQRERQQQCSGAQRLSAARKTAAVTAFTDYAISLVYHITLGSMSAQRVFAEYEIRLIEHRATCVLHHDYLLLTASEHLFTSPPRSGNDIVRPRRADVFIFGRFFAREFSSPQHRTRRAAETCAALARNQRAHE